MRKIQTLTTTAINIHEYFIDEFNKMNGSYYRYDFRCNINTYNKKVYYINGGYVKLMDNKSLNIRTYML